MKKTILSLASLLLIFSSLSAQKYLTRTGQISFFSETPVENIEAHHSQVTSIFNSDNGELVFSLLMKGFQFEKALMQEHFNEKYVESDKYPKATFKGKIANLENLNMEEEGTYEVQVEGTLSIHGVNQEVSVPATLTIEGSDIIAKAEFPVEVATYRIEVPSVVRDNIAENVSISVQMKYELFQKSGR